MIPNMVGHAASDPEVRKQMIADSSSEQLEEIRQHVLGRMQSLLQGTGPVHGDYATWSAFLGEVKVAQRKRANIKAEPPTLIVVTESSKARLS
jgi:hypothetical protein